MWTAGSGGRRRKREGLLEAGLREEGEEEGNWESRTPSRRVWDALELILAFSTRLGVYKRHPKLASHVPS